MMLDPATNEPMSLDAFLTLVQRTDPLRIDLRGHPHEQSGPSDHDRRDYASGDDSLALVIEAVRAHWMPGRRHKLGLALAGACAKLDWPLPLTQTLIRRLVETTDDDDDREDVGRDTYRRLQEGRPVLGYQGLAELLPEPAVNSVMQAIAAARAPAGMRRVDAIRYEKGLRSFERKRRISRVVLSELREDGRLIHADGPRFYWLDGRAKALLPLDGADFAGHLDRTFGLNPSEQEFRYVIEEVRTAILVQPRVPVFRQFHFEEVTDVLHVHLGAGIVATLDGHSIREEKNGDSVLFEGNGFGLDEFPVPTGRAKPISWLVRGIAFDDTAMPADLQRALLRYSLRAIPFIDRIRTRTILAFVGPKGSGKSAACRKVVQFYLGPDADVSTLDDQDDFETATIGSFLLAVDNLDQGSRWINDLLAKTSTGHIIERRELYTTARLVRYQPRCWLLLNARTPEFKREDVADRLLLLRLRQRDEFKDERTLLAPLHDPARRSALVGDFLTDLNFDVAAVGKGASAVPPEYRMQDFASVAFAIAEARGEEEELARAIVALQTATTDFSLEDDPIMEEVAAWPDDRVWRSAGELYDLREKSAFRSRASLAATLRGKREGLGRSGLIDFQYDQHRKMWLYRHIPCGGCGG